MRNDKYGYRRMYRSNIIYIDTLQFNGVSCMESVMEEQTTDPNGYCYLGERKIMSDLISREDALKPFCTAPDGTRIPEVDCDNFPVAFSVEFIKKHLLSLPSAEAEWIPCSDRLPSEDGLYLIQTNYMYHGLPNMEVYYWAEGWNCYRYCDGTVGRENEIDGIIAWMPLPMPYRETSEVEE